MALTAPGLLADLADKYDQFMSMRDPRTLGWGLTGDLKFVLPISLGYLYIVKVWGPRWMAQRKPYKLKSVITAYNLFQVIVNGFFFVQYVRHSYVGGGYNVFCQGVSYSRDSNSMAILNLSWCIASATAQKRAKRCCSLTRVSWSRKDSPDSRWAMSSTTCSAVGCTDNPVRNPELRFHQFPKDRKRHKVWVGAVRRMNFGRPSTPSSNAKLCSQHFTPDTYTRDLRLLTVAAFCTKRASLKNDAVPSLFAYRPPDAPARSAGRSRSRLI
ncbi:hypothetical protein HPB47_028416 [Ixodes persulcatus]|uniref:Uncharacterized protein n=1 Tax=Ixodes persulcatus TaxID=34615 RepID=A0AC60PT97_IXOPE|nr:hypothetical protein HPB47_028416 [Ixodes persulcatus]